MFSVQLTENWVLNQEVIEILLGGPGENEVLELDHLSINILSELGVISIINVALILVVDDEVLVMFKDGDGGSLCMDGLDDIIEGAQQRVLVLLSLSDIVLEFFNHGFQPIVFDWRVLLDFLGFVSADDKVGGHLIDEGEMSGDETLGESSEEGPVLDSEEELDGLELGEVEVTVVPEEHLTLDVIEGDVAGLFEHSGGLTSEMSLLKALPDERLEGTQETETSLSVDLSFGQEIVGLSSVLVSFHLGVLFFDEGFELAEPDQTFDDFPVSEVHVLVVLELFLLLLGGGDQLLNGKLENLGLDGWLLDQFEVLHESLAGSTVDHEGHGGHTTHVEEGEFSESDWEFIVDGDHQSEGDTEGSSETSPDDNVELFASQSVPGISENRQEHTDHQESHTVHQDPEKEHSDPI